MSYELSGQTLGDLGFSLKPPKAVRRILKGAASVVKKIGLPIAAAVVAPIAPVLAPVAMRAIGGVLKRVPATLARRITPAVQAAANFNRNEMQGLRRVRRGAITPRATSATKRWSNMAADLPLGVTTTFTRKPPTGIDRGVTQGPAGKWISGQLSRGSRVGKIVSAVGPTLAAREIARRWGGSVTHPTAPRLAAMARAVNVTPVPSPERPVPALIPPGMPVPIAYASPAAAAAITPEPEPGELTAMGIQGWAPIALGAAALLLMMGKRR